MNPVQPNLSAVPDDPIAATQYAKLAAMRAALDREPYPSAAVRKDRLRRGIDALLKYEDRIVEAARADFGARPEVTSLLADVMVPMQVFRNAHKRVEKWMRPEKHKPEFPLGLIGARAFVFYQPIGVVGIVGPWNAPLGLSWSPLASALAAGNRAMVKPSEMTPNISALMAEMTADAFAEDEVTVIEGGLEVSKRFISLPFDHMVFTGGTGTGRHILRAAAENLTPVTLELGGKSPTIVARGADLQYAAEKIVAIKMLNSGQICMSPDYVLVHRDDRDALAQKIAEVFNRHYPNFASNPDVTNVHMARNRERLCGIVEDAVRRGAVVKPADGSAVADIGRYERMPLTLIVEPPQDAAAMQEELFGPVLPIIAYDTLEEAVTFIRHRERPLALYFLGGNAEQQDYVLKNTYAGGVSLDEVMFHPFHQDLPFGGVGHSGMGKLAGFSGFKTLSAQKSVAKPAWIDVTKHMAPPFTPKMAKMLKKALRFDF